MKNATLTYTPSTGWLGDGCAASDANLVLYFGARADIQDGVASKALRQLFPKADVLGCSTGGNILGGDLTDSLVAVAMSFSRTETRIASISIADADASFASGQTLGQKLLRADLAGIVVLSDGLHVNGSELVAGLEQAVGGGIPISGGLAGDGADFVETLVGVNGKPQANMIAAIGFYGSAIRLNTGSGGGWDVFGPRREITKSTGNILQEIDGEPALDLYERYLGAKDAAALPGSALLFPLKIYDPSREGHNVVRTVLAIDRDARTMTFAGDVPEGWQSQLMHGNMNRLVAGAAAAAGRAQLTELPPGTPSLSLLVSCIGRRLLMGQRTPDEVDAVREVLGEHATQIGFYSYGELCPHLVTGASELHNQTMTITTISEAI